MKIAVFGRKFEEAYNTGIINFFKKISGHCCEVYIFKPFLEFLKEIPGFQFQNYKEFETHEEINAQLDFFFSLGGDGTFLESVRYVRNTEIPIVGINTGRLGFLANISLNEIEESIDLLLNGTYQLENRNLLLFKSTKNPFSLFPYALNEISVQKHDNTLITIEASVNGQELNTYWADGLIISTPTGSTAYSMSTGGPIVSPDCEVFIISPIASHNLTVRPMVLPNKQEICLRITSRSGSFLATIDSQSHVFPSGAEIKLQLAPFIIKIVRLSQHTFFNTIRKKLMWGADIRN